MTIEQLVDYLRITANVQDPDNLNEVDTQFTSLNNDGLKLFFQVVLSRDFPEVQSLDEIPSESVYGLVLLAKKELYYTLATVKANEFNITADNNNSLRRSQRFEHYMALIKQTDEEYNKYINDGGSGGNTLGTYDVLLSNRYATVRNHNLGLIPSFTLHTREVGSTYVDLEWVITRISQFRNVSIYLSDKAIVDRFMIGNKISPEATLVVRIKDQKQTACRVENLAENTTYRIAVVLYDLNGLMNYKEIILTTLESG